MCSEKEALMTVINLQLQHHRQAEREPLLGEEAFTKYRKDFIFQYAIRTLWKCGSGPLGEIRTMDTSQVPGSSNESKVGEVDFKIPSPPEQ
jgi:hypothetical protein